MKLTYFVTADDRRQGQHVYDAALAPMRWLTAIAEPFSFAALGFAIYCYATGDRVQAVTLFASFAYLFSKGFLLRFIRDLLASRRNPEPQHLQLETGNNGINYDSSRHASPSFLFWSLLLCCASRLGGDEVRTDADQCRAGDYGADGVGCGLDPGHRD